MLFRERIGAAPVLTPEIQKTIIPNPSGINADTDRILVICIEFPDVVHTRTTADIYNQFFSQTQKSLRNFFDQNSYGKYLPEGLVYGWYTAQHNKSWYYTTGTEYDLNVEVVNMINSSNMDLLYIDKDNNKRIDYIFIIYAGDQTIGGGTNGGLYNLSGGYTTNTFSFAAERPISGWSALATMCHEHAHQLGFINMLHGGLFVGDMYVSACAGCALGSYSLMSDGVFLDNGGTPSHLDGVNKWILGFANSVVNRTGSVTVPDAENYDINYIYKTNKFGMTGDSYFYPGYAVTKYELFLVENRQKIGYDYYLPGNGIIIYYAYYEKFQVGGNVSWIVRIKQADGLNQIPSVNGGDAGDPYPGSSNNRNFGKNTNPNTSLIDGSIWDLEITNISDSGSIMSFLASMPAQCTAPQAAMLVV